MYSAEVLANAQMQAAEIEAEGRRRRQQQMAQLIGTGLSTAAGFAVGGPAGGALALAGGAAGMMGPEGAAIAPALQTLAGHYANKKALDAKDTAYTSFFSKHGKDLGFDPGYLDELRSMSRDDRLMAFDLMTSQPGQRLGSLQYMNEQASLFGGGRGSGTGAGGGGGGGQAGGYTVGQGWR